MKKKPYIERDVLVAILKDKKDFAILQEQGWYRIPVSHAPRRWPPKWLAFYQPLAFKEDAYRIRYYGEIDNIQVLSRKELFPNEIPNAKSEHLYYRIQLKKLEERQPPIPSLRPRRLVFVPTTWKKFLLADQINDLFDYSPPEDLLWRKLKQLEILAERQWAVHIKNRFFFLDFALFCNQGKINIETDGDTWHADRARIPQDNERDNALATDKWHVLRFNGKQIREQMDTYCLGQVFETINQLGGLVEEKQVPRLFYKESGNTIEQMSLFDPSEEYEATTDEEYDLD